jgi:hypothetical protein
MGDEDPCDLNPPVEIVQGSSKTFNLAIIDVDTGDAYNADPPLQIWCTLKERFEDLQPLILKQTANAGGSTLQISPIDPQSGTTNGVSNLGRAQIFFLPTDTAKLKVAKIYWIDVWVVTSTGEERPIVKRRRAIIGPRVTRITPT